MKSKAKLLGLGVVLVLIVFSVFLLVSLHHKNDSNIQTFHDISYESESISLEEFYLSFDLAPNEYAFSEEIYSVATGETQFIIDACTWEPPTENVWIGFYNIETEVDYGDEFSGGKISYQELDSVNLPAGTYQIKVKNIGDLNIEGTMYYRSEAVVNEETDKGAEYVALQHGYRITELETDMKIDLFVPVYIMPDSIYSQTGYEFDKDEVILFQTRTTTLYLKSAKFSDETEEYVQFDLGFSYNLSESSEIITHMQPGFDGPTRVKLETGSEAMWIGADPKGFSLKVESDTVRNAEEMLLVQVLGFNRIVYETGVANHEEDIQQQSGGEILCVVNNPAITNSKAYREYIQQECSVPTLAQKNNVDFEKLTDAIIEDLADGIISPFPDLETLEQKAAAAAERITTVATYADYERLVAEMNSRYGFSLTVVPEERVNTEYTLSELREILKQYCEFKLSSTGVLHPWQKPGTESPNVHHYTVTKTHGNAAVSVTLNAMIGVRKNDDGTYSVDDPSCFSSSVNCNQEAWFFVDTGSGTLSYTLAQNQFGFSRVFDVAIGQVFRDSVAVAAFYRIDSATGEVIPVTLGTNDKNAPTDLPTGIDFVALNYED